MHVADEEHKTSTRSLITAAYTFHARFMSGEPKAMSGSSSLSSAATAALGTFAAIQHSGEYFISFQLEKDLHTCPRRSPHPTSEYCHTNDVVLHLAGKMNCCHGA
jgi:hypothetical protein